MSKTTEPVAPFLLLNSLRALAPQFAETDRTGNFAQQGKSFEIRIEQVLMVDADEAWTQLISALRAALPRKEGDAFIDKYMGVELSKTYVDGLCPGRTSADDRLTCAETDAEPSTTSAEQVLKLECNISISTNFLASGILDVS